MSSLAEEMKRHALEAQKFSRKHLVLELDYSAESVQEIESQVDSLEYTIKGGKSDENMSMLVSTWGAYLGEALRKKCGGEWVQDDAGRIGLQVGTRVAHPQEQVQKRLVEGREHDLLAYFERTLGELSDT